MKKLLRVKHSSSTEPHWVGDGFYVRQLFSPNEDGSEMSPFLMLDYAIPMEFSAGGVRRGVGSHPHRGFETVTVVYQGELEHRDSSGNGGRIGPGDVQWMTAAGGIIHEEYHSLDFAKKGGTLEMVQLWVNLPARDKNAQAGYQTLLEKEIPAESLDDGAGTVRVIAGSFSSVKGPARTFTPIDLWSIKLTPGKTARIPLRDGYTSAFLVLHGEVMLGTSDKIGEQELAVLTREGEGASIWSEAGATLLVMHGEPIEEPIAAYGPFVMNTREEIQEAFKEYQAGKMGRIA